MVLVPFPFTDQSGTKKRPAVVVSSASYNAGRRDIVIMAITSLVGGGHMVDPGVRRDDGLNVSSRRTLGERRDPMEGCTR